ncbi:MATE family efflux transporter, partial [Sphaerochaeta sp.]
AQNLGSGHLERVREGVRSAVLLCILFSAIALALIFLFGRQLALLFIDQSEQQVIGQTVQYLHTISYFFIPLGLIFVFRNTSQGLGSGLIPMLSSIQELIFRALVALTLPPVLGYVGICLSSPIAWMAAALLLLVAYKLQYRRISCLLKQ